MAEQRLERNLRAALADDLDPVHGPHPRWTDAPVARQIAAGRPATAGWRTVALLVAATVGAVAIAVLVSGPRDVPAGTAPPATLEPWPSAVAPDATPTLGEIPLGRVAVATAFGEPALLVRVSEAGRARDLETGRDGMRLHVEVRVIGELDPGAGVDRFVLLRGGRPVPDRRWPTSMPGLPVAADAPVGTEGGVEFVVFFEPHETVDLGWLGSGSSVAFRYPIHRPPPVPSVVEQGRCPTLEDYELASLQPSADPAAPSFEPVAPAATPSTGLLEAGEIGVIPAPDGSPGALVRVSNIRFCDRLPDYRPDAMGGPAKLLLADVEIEALQAATLPTGFIPGKSGVVANYGGRFDLSGGLVFGMPGSNWTTSLDVDPGFAYRGTMVWVAPDTDVRITIDVKRRTADGEGPGTVQFSYLARDGVPDPWTPRTPEPSSDPAATPTAGTARPGETVILAADGGTMPLVVYGVDQVPRYPGLVPTPPAEAFMEIGLVFGPGSGTFRWNADEWVVTGPDGAALPLVTLPDAREGNDGLPNLITIGKTGEVPPDYPRLPWWLIAEVPASGRVVLEYRPDDGPALVTWVLRER